MPRLGQQRATKYPNVSASPNAYFAVYSKPCAPTFYAEVALSGGASAIEVFLYTDMFRSQYGRDCASFYEAEVMPRQMAGIISADPMFATGVGGLSDVEAQFLGQRFWIEMTSVEDRCASRLFTGVELDNRALSRLADKANFGDVLAVGKGILSTFAEMQSQGFNHFRTDGERCDLARESARALVRELADEGLLARNEMGI